jgi:hypothetical protein
VKERNVPRRARGNGCCRGADWICSIPRRSTSKSRISLTAFDGHSEHLAANSNTDHILDITDSQPVTRDFLTINVNFDIGRPHYPIRKHRCGTYTIHLPDDAESLAGGAAHDDIHGIPVEQRREVRRRKRPEILLQHVLDNGGFEDDTPPDMATDGFAAEFEKVLSLLLDGVERRLG